MADQYTFQAETQQLLDILIHSLYTEKSIFLRELISNASDALNRMQFELLTNRDVLDPDADLRIHLKTDEEAGVLTISDTGIGMTAEEMVEHLGTIARSGARAFMQAMADGGGGVDAQDIIGQFGVGFYSVFMVAEKVEVVSRTYRPDAEAARWTATGGTSFTVEGAERPTRGTDVIITFREEDRELLNGWRIRETIRRHSDYIAFPIYVDDDENPTNKQTAIWRQAPDEIEASAYDDFYKMLTLDFNQPLHRVHMRADVPMQFYALLYVPSSREPNMFSPRKEPGLKLYARKVLIQEYSKDLLPDYLQFIQGVVDTEDLPLNVNRESYQANRVIASLKKSLTTKVLGDLKRMAKKDTDAYLPIYDAFGPFLKQGLVNHPDDRDTLQELLFFNSSHDDDPESWHRLADYVERLAPGQEDIYYVVADDFGAARRSPHLDAFRERGIEVLYFSDPMDAILPIGLGEYQGHTLRSVDEAGIDLKDVGAAAPAEDTAPDSSLAEDAFAALQERFERVLGARVKGVRASQTLTSNPARLVSEDGGADRHMHRISRYLDHEVALPVKTLELNVRHTLLHNIQGLLAAGGDDAMIDAVIEQVFEDALLQDGIHPDPASMVGRMTRILEVATGSTGVDFSALRPAAAAASAQPEGDAHVEDTSAQPEAAAEDASQTEDTEEGTDDR
jgi:molecular chaperone HtpG